MTVDVYGPVSIKRRLIPHFNGVGRYWYTQPGGGGVSPLPYFITGKQETVSKRNPLWGTVRQLLADKNPDGSYVAQGRNRRLLQNLDIGGDFFTTKTTYDQTLKEWGATSKSIGNVTNFYSGPLFARDSQVGPLSTLWPVLPDMETQRLNLLTYGAAAIASTAPTNPAMSLSNALGELYRDGLPHMFGSILRKKGSSFKSLSEEYLNYEFGWKPLISDLTNLAQIVVKSKKLVDQYLRDSGKPIARSRTFPTLTQVTSSSQGTQTVSPPVSTNLFVTPSGYQGPRKLEVRSTTDYWFEGVFSYFVPLGDDQESQLERAASLAEHLLGLNVLTPEVLWNLAPWTWLADWFLNIGDIVTNASNFMRDGLVMRRGYVMCHTVVQHIYTLEGIRFVSGTPGTITQIFGSESKIRRRATPWGFGLVPGAFTPRQWAILVALGISRSDIGK